MDTVHWTLYDAYYMCVNFTVCKEFSQSSHTNTRDHLISGKRKLEYNMCER